MKKAASSRNTELSTEDFRSIITRSKVTPTSLNSFSRVQYQTRVDQQLPTDGITIRF